MVAGVNGASNGPNKKKTRNYDYSTGDLAHLREDGKAHDWREKGHGGIRVPGGEVNPHGQRGGKTWPSGRRKYDKDGNLIYG